MNICEGAELEQEFNKLTDLLGRWVLDVLPVGLRKVGAGPFCSHVPNGPFNAYLSS